jgi:nitrogen fixation/metabolism regulation signal transduction histidine kinase
LPALLLGAIATRRISDAIDRLQNPGVEASLSRSARLSREWIDRVRRDADRVLDELPREVPVAGTAERNRVGVLLRRDGFDFAAYEGAGGRSDVIVAAPDSSVRPDASKSSDARGASSDAPAAAPSALPTPDDWDLLASEGMPSALSGRTLRFFRAGAGARDFGRAVGATIESDLALALESAGGDYGRYLQLQLFEEVQKRLVWISMGGVLFLTTIAAYLAARVTAKRISRPVQDLARAADRLATGDLSHRASVTADGEIGELVTAFNRMSAQLEHSQDELLRVERLAAWRDVARRIAHEIRNPLTPIKVAIHRLQRRLPEDDDVQECLRSIDEEVESLTRISVTFSEFAKMPEARFAPTDLAEIARSVVELFHDSTPGVAVEYRGDERVPLVADRDQLRRAATNLVKNACEALGAHGCVVVSATREGGHAVLRVTDDGRGIAPEVRDSLFRPGISTKTEGSGLGLAVVQRIASDHRGTLRCSNLPIGAEFALEIPNDLEEDE